MKLLREVVEAAARFLGLRRKLRPVQVIQLPPYALK